MAYSNANQTFDNFPNSGNPFEIATSYNTDQLDGAADEFGVGSLVNRSVASNLLYYYYAKFPFDQMSQLFGSLETTPTGHKEFFEADALFEFEAAGVQEDATDVINNTDGVNTYVPAASGVRYVVDTDDKNIFQPYSEVRYATASGWQHAYVTSIADAAAETELNLESIDGSNLPVAAANTSVIQHIATNLPQDLDYDEQPRQTQPVGEITYCENFRRDTKATRKEVDINRNGGTVYDLISHFEKQLAENFRADREMKTLLGSGDVAVKTMSNGDKVYFSNGIYYQIRDQNLHTSDLTTGGSFDSEKFINAMHQFMLYNFGAESGGPQMKDFYVDPLMQDYFDRAWEDKERFMGGNVTTEFVAGVSVTRFAKTQGVMDIMPVPNWSARHPIIDGQLRGGSAPKAVGLLLPMDSDHVVRVQQEGRGPQQIVWKDNPASRITNSRMESVEGLHIRQKQHAAVFEEVAP